MLIHSRVLPIVLGILHLVVCSNGSVAFKSNAMIVLEPRRRRGSSSFSTKNHKRKREIPEEDMSAILERHNVLRAQEGASDMEYMKWNPQLAELAQEWADRCFLEHGHVPYDKGTFPYKKIGQNLWAHDVEEMNYIEAIQDFYDEKQWYDYDDIECNPPDSTKMCGHYTQVVWAETYELGCGFSFCEPLENSQYEDNKAAYFVCNYGPTGNLINTYPFKKGEACSQCGSGKAWCTDGLCNDECTEPSETCDCRVSCKHCGIADHSSCSCSCKRGWTGADCSAECKDKNASCGAIPGWPVELCTSSTSRGKFVRRTCPLMCELCNG